jgi:hypothetical protein
VTRRPRHQRALALRRERLDEEVMPREIRYAIPFTAFRSQHPSHLRRCPVKRFCFTLLISEVLLLAAGTAAAGQPVNNRGAWTWHSA